MVVGRRLGEKGLEKLERGERKLGSMEPFDLEAV